MTCLKCGASVSAKVSKPWGEPQPHNKPPDPFLPFICGQCGSLLIIEVATDRLIDPPKSIVNILKGNPVLWAAITEAQERAVLGHPERRRGAKG